MCLEGYKMRWKWQKRKTEKKCGKKDRKERKKLEEARSRLETEGVAEKQCRKIRAEDHPFHRFEFWFLYYYTQMFWSEKGKHLWNKVGTPAAIPVLQSVTSCLLWQNGTTVPSEGTNQWNMKNSSGSEKEWLIIKGRLLSFKGRAL